MELNRLNENQVVVGTVLPWDVYNSDGRLLMRKGYLVQNQKQISGLLKAGLFRMLSPPGKVRDTIRTAGEQFTHWGQRISKIHDGILAQQNEVSKQVLMLATEIQHTVADNRNAILAAVHLYSDGRHTAIAPIKVAIICEFIAITMAISEEDRQLIVAAALTSNLGMREIQDDLVGWAQPLNEEQLHIVHKHPEHSVAILTAAGITDPIWHRLVLEHHEQMDGTGYPNGLMRSGIAEGSFLLSLAEIYIGMISERLYRPSMRAKEALRALFMCRGRRIDEHTTQIFIKTIGIYPPGTIVRLASNEVALVVASRDKATTPLVKAVTSPHGDNYTKPVSRDTDTREYAITEMLDKSALQGHHWDDLIPPLRHARRSYSNPLDVAMR